MHPVQYLRYIWRKLFRHQKLLMYSVPVWTSIKTDNIVWWFVADGNQAALFALRFEWNMYVQLVYNCGWILNTSSVCNNSGQMTLLLNTHDDVIKWKHFPRYWPFVRGIHQSPVHSPDKGQWRGALMFSLISTWINGWVNNREAGDLRRHRAHYYVIVMNNVINQRKTLRLNLESGAAGHTQAIYFTSKWLEMNYLL